MKLVRLMGAPPGAGVAALTAFAVVSMFRGGGDLYFGAGGADLATQFYPWRVFLCRWLERGALPLWNPHNFSGYPVLEAQQMALFDPVSIIPAALLPPRLGLLTTMAGQTILVLLLTWIGLRRFARLSPAAAAFGALTYGFGTTVATRVWAGHVTVVAALAWMPFSLLATLRAVERLGSAPTGGSGVSPMIPGGSDVSSEIPSRLGILPRIFFDVFARPWRGPDLRSLLLLVAVADAMMIFVGSPQYIVYLFWMQIAILAAATRPRARLAALAFIGFSWAIGLVVACPQWLPTLSYLPFTERAATTFGRWSAEGDRSTFLMETLLPFPFGDDARVVHAHTKSPCETSAYPGALAVLLAGACVARVLARRGGRPSARRRAAVALIALGFYLCLGGWLPGFAMFREPLRARAVLAIGLSLAASVEADWIRGAARRGRIRAPRPEFALAATLAAASAIAMVWVALRGDNLANALLDAARPKNVETGRLLDAARADPGIITRRLEASLGALLVFSLAVTAISFAARKGAGRGALAVLLAAGCLEPYLQTVAFFRSTHPFAAAELPAELRDYFAPRIEAARRKGERPWRVSLHADPGAQNTAIFLEGLWDTGGYDPLMPRAAAGLLGLRTDEAQAPPFGVRYCLPRWDPSDSTSVARAIESRRRFANEGVASIERRVVARALAKDVFGPTPEGDHCVAPGNRAGGGDASAPLPEDFAAAIEAIRAAAPASEALAPGESLDMTWLSPPNRHEFRARLRQPGVLVVRATRLPGWRVRVDDRPAARPLVADNWMLAAVVPSGDHRIVFTYEPVAWKLTRWVSAGACATLLVGVLASARASAARRRLDRICPSAGRRD